MPCRKRKDTIKGNEKKRSMEIEKVGDDSDDMKGDCARSNVPGSQFGLEKTQEFNTEQVQDSSVEAVQRETSNGESHQTEQLRSERPKKPNKFSKGQTVLFH